MSTEAVSAGPAPDTGPVAPLEVHDDPRSPAQASDDTESAKHHSAPVFLHSPPDSNNAAKTDASDSELSELDEEPVLADAPPGLPIDPPVVEDIGEVLPDHWSGAVPVFRPTMHQFKDFKLFVSRRLCDLQDTSANHRWSRWKRSTAMA